MIIQGNFEIKYPKLSCKGVPVQSKLLKYQSSYNIIGIYWQLSYFICIGFNDFSQLLVSGTVPTAPEPVLKMCLNQKVQLAKRYDSSAFL